MLFCLLILAIALRMGAPEVVEFKQDEANLSQMARDMAQGKYLPTRAIDSSIGIPQPPTPVYFLAVPYWLTSDPVFATQFTAFSNVLAVLFVYLITRRYFGVPAALMAAVLFAAAPWAVVYSRKLWPPDQLAFLTLATFGTGLLGFYEGKRWGQLLFLPLLAFTGQNHYLNIVLVPMALYILWIGRRSLKREFFLSVALAAMVCLPYLSGEAFTALLDTVRSGSSFFSNASEPRPLTFSAEVWAWLAELTSGVGIGQWAGDLSARFQASLGVVGSLLPLLYAIPAAMLAATLWLIQRVLVGRQVAHRQVMIALLLWLVVTPLFFSVTWYPEFNDHYLIPSHAACFIALGIGLGTLWERSAIIRLPLGIMLMGAVALQSITQVALVTFVAQNATPNGFSTPLGQYMKARAAVLAENPRQVLGKLDGQYIGYNEQASIWNFLLNDVPVVRFLQAGIEVYPSEPALLISNRCDAPFEESFYWRRDPDTGVPEGCFHLDERQPSDFEPTDYTPVSDSMAALRFENSARIVRYQWQPEQGCLVTVWQADMPARGPVSDFFEVAVKFHGADGTKLVDADSYFWLGRYWRAGDWIVRTFCAEAARAQADSIASVRLGLYTIEDRRNERIFHNVNVVDATGTPIGQQIEIALR